MQRLAIFVPVLLVLAGCGGGYGGSNNSSQGSTSGSVVKTIQISEKEYALTPSAVTVSKTGTYAFKVTNNGSTTHALEVEGMGVETKSSHIQPGSSATIQVTLSKNGTYQMYCPIDGHKQEGMKGDVTVGNGSSGGMTTNEDTTTDRGGGYGY
jgi:uncharacterized cupredoxin-like copper-binding protein